MTTNKMSDWDIVNNCARLAEAGWEITMRCPEGPGKYAFVVSIHEKGNDVAFEAGGDSIGEAFNKCAHELNKYFEAEYNAQFAQAQKMNDLRLSVRSVEQQQAENRKWEEIRKQREQEALSADN